MSMKLSFELSDRDLKYFRDALAASRNAVRDAEESEIIEAIRQVLDDIRGNQPLPDFVARRIPELEALIMMLLDDEWRLPRGDRERLLAAFVYFGDPEDILPDDVPVIGYLDDVIMIELVNRELRHVREAYGDFCRFRDDFDADNGSEVDGAVRRDRLDRRRRQLHQRMRRRTARDRKAKLW
ncbi:MAG: YkvA family protein [Woeseiaceae bacterium]|nr:YkvA family protein [Woeseiaceae bacterium]